MGEPIDVITPPCPMCRQTHVVTVDSDDLQKNLDGAHVQDAFPYLSSDDREMLISGTDPECWDKMFEGMDDDEDFEE
jgi:hypothetical protein